MDPLPLFIGLVLGLILGLVVGMLVMRGRAAQAPAGDDPAVLEARHQVALSEVRAQEQSVQAQLGSQLAGVQATAEALRERMSAMQAQHSEQVSTLQSQHREMIERQRSEAQSQAERDRAESKVLQALTPVQESLRIMQAKVTELERERSTQYGSIAEQLKQAQVSDEQLRVTTEQLASALRSNSTRGVWGETQLKRIVESAGLTQYVDFFTQHSVSTDAGAGRPDMVVRLPGNKSIAIDSKVPLEHYIEASQIPLSAIGEEAARRSGLIDRHVKAVRSHVDALAKKTYWEGLDASPEFVIAFIPSESLLSSALEADPSLLEYAFSKRVALASPVNLWAVLKTVAFTWQQQAVSDEAKKLFDLGNQLYQRLGTLAGHAESMRKAIERTVDSYNKFASSLESRVLVTARQFPGIDETKLDLVTEPQAIHTAPQKLTAGELTAGEAAAGEAAGELMAGEAAAATADDDATAPELDDTSPETASSEPASPGRASFDPAQLDDALDLSEFELELGSSEPAERSS